MIFIYTEKFFFIKGGSKNKISFTKGGSIECPAGGGIRTLPFRRGVTVPFPPMPTCAPSLPPSSLGETEAGIVSAAPQAVKLVEGGFLPFALSCNNRTTERDAFFSHRHGGGGERYTGPTTNSPCHRVLLEWSVWFK